MSEATKVEMYSYEEVEQKLQEQAKVNKQMDEVISVLKQIRDKKK